MEKIRVKVKIDLTGTVPTLRVRVKKGQDPHIVDVDHLDHALADDGQDAPVASKGTLVVWDCDQPGGGASLYFQGADTQDSTNAVLSFKDMNGNPANGDPSLSDKRIFTPNGGVANSRLRIKMTNRNRDDDPQWLKYSLTAMYKASASAPAIPIMIDPMVRYIGR